jgi:hypothetical protein
MTAVACPVPLVNFHQKIEQRKIVKFTLEILSALAAQRRVSRAWITALPTMPNPRASLVKRAPQGRELLHTATGRKKRRARRAQQVFPVLVAQVNVTNVKRANFALLARRLRGAAPQGISARSLYCLVASVCGALLRNFAKQEHIAHQVRLCRYHAWKVRHVLSQLLQNWCFRTLF